MRDADSQYQRLWGRFDHRKCSVECLVPGTEVGVRGRVAARGTRSLPRDLPFRECLPGTRAYWERYGWALVSARPGGWHFICITWRHRLKHMVKTQLQV